MITTIPAKRQRGHEQKTRLVRKKVDPGTKVPYIIVIKSGKFCHIILRVSCSNNTKERLFRRKATKLNGEVKVWMKNKQIVKESPAIKYSRKPC